MKLNQAIQFVAAAFAMISLSVTSHAGEPQDLTILRDSYQRAIERAVNPVQGKYIEELRKLKLRYTKDGKLEDAILVDKELSKMIAEPEKADSSTKKSLATGDPDESICIEGEYLKIGKGSGGTVTEQPMQGFQGHWSNDRQLVWVTAKPGDTLELTMSVKKAGNYQVRAQFTKAPDYGIFDVFLDGKKVGDKIDLYNIRVEVSGLVDLGDHKLQAGEHTLKIIIKGANPLAIKSYMFGIDFIELAQHNNGPFEAGRK